MSALFFTQAANACTAFGAITESGTIIGKNRDYFYGPQTVGLVLPLQRFHNWHGNHYHHKNQFFALTASDGVAMGVNKHGLSAIEEDTLRPKDAKQHKRFFEPKNGTVDGMVLYGVLQNFNTIDEMLPYLSNIFSTAAPDFYQFSDPKKILTVEVAFGNNDTDATRPFKYRVLSKKNDYFTHTNTYVNPQFCPLNKLASSERSLNGANNRLKTITTFMSQSKHRTINEAAKWFMNTASFVSNQDDKNGCQNTSIFRSDLQGTQSISLRTQHDKIYGTASSLIISNHGDLTHSDIYLKMVDSITTDAHGNQIIHYKDLRTTLANLFSGSKLPFMKHQFVRKRPIKGLCL